MQRLSKQGTFAAAGLIVLITLAAYLPALWAGFIWDDDAYVTNNLALRDAAGLSRIWLDTSASPQYYPLVFTTFWLEYQLWGLHPLGYHLINILLHATVAVLLWSVLRRLELPGAWLAAAIFALHPVHVESVAWITERKNVLSGIFYFLSLSAYLRFRPLTREPPDEPKRWGFYMLALAAFVAALLSKTVTCSLPAALLLLIWWKRGRLGWREIAPLTAFFAIGLLLAVNTIRIESGQVGAEGPEWDFSMTERTLIAARATWFYAAKLIFPVHLTLIYGRWSVDAAVWWQYLFPLASVAAVVALWLLRRRWGRGPLAAYLYFVGTLFPALGFFNIYPFRYAFAADHFQYLPSIGLITLLAAAAATFMRRTAEPTRRVLRGLSATALLVFGVLVARQCLIYRDLETLWLDTIAKTPTARMAYNNLGSHYVETGRADQAAPLYEQAVRLAPHDEKSRFNLAHALALVGRVDESVEQYGQALRLRPGWPEALYNLANLLSGAGRMDEAIETYRRALAADPSSAQTHINLAATLFNAGRLEDAARHFREALRMQPDWLEPRANLGGVLQQMGRLDEAIAEFEQVLRLEPRFVMVRYNLGAALLARDKVEEAARAFGEVLKLRPDDAAARVQLARALVRLGRSRQAENELRTALRLAPQFAEAHYELGRLLESRGDLEEALEQFRAALAADPEHEQAVAALKAAIEKSTHP